jgi:hypothetical protein
MPWLLYLTGVMLCDAVPWIKRWRERDVLSKVFRGDVSQERQALASKPIFELGGNEF